MSECLKSEIEKEEQQKLLYDRGGGVGAAVIAFINSALGFSILFPPGAVGHDTVVGAVVPPVRLHEHLNRAEIRVQSLAATWLVRTAGRPGDSSGYNHKSDQ